MNIEPLRLRDFHGGLHLDYHKDLVDQAPIAIAPIPPQLVIPLAQHVGAPADVCVKVGDRVRRGDVIGRAHGYVSLPVHASSSGTVVAIEDRAVAHPSRVPALCVIIDTDGEDEAAPPQWTVRPDYRDVESHELREIARSAGIAGLGGASFPTAVKLNPGRPVDTLIINGAECEPYIACDQALMREDAEQIIAGVHIMMHALDAPKCIIGVEDNKPAAIAALRDAVGTHEAIQVVVVPTRYPQGGEKQLIQTVTGREVPSQGLPLDIGIICQNPGTVRALYRAVVHGEPLIDRVVSLTGHAMAQPRNVRARIGTPLRFLVEHFGGYSETPGRLIMGGPMMGILLPDDDIPVVKATNCLLAMRADEVAPPEPAMPCIRCGACAEVCPARLLPQQLYWHARAREFDKTQDYNLFDCIECGCCAAVCPSQIPLVQYYRFAKSEIWAEERERRAADAARVRYEERLQRLEREEAEKQAERAARKKRARAAAIGSADDPVTQALAAARNKKLSSEGQADDAAPAAAAEAPADDPVARALAAAKAKKAAKAAQPPSSEKADGERNDADDPVARALAKAREKKAARQQSTDSASQERNSSNEAPKDGAADDAVAQAIARAKEKKAARQAQAANATDTVDGDAPTCDDSDPIERARAKARAAKAARASAATQQGDNGTADKSAARSAVKDDDADDPVARAIAAAKARKAARQQADTTTAAPAASTSTSKDGESPS